MFNLIYFLNCILGNFSLTNAKRFSVEFHSFFTVGVFVIGLSSLHYVNAHCELLRGECRICRFQNLFDHGNPLLCGSIITSPTTLGYLGQFESHCCPTSLLF